MLRPNRTPEYATSGCLCRWLPNVFAVGEDEAIKLLGLDSWVFLTFLSCCWEVTMFCCLVGWIVLVSSPNFYAPSVRIEIFYLL